jgi:hypothetical protein
VVLVRKAVYHWDSSMASEFLYDFLSKGSNHDGIYVTREDPRGVGKRFPSGELQVVSGKKDSSASQALHACFERDPGSCGGLFKEEGEDLTHQGPMRDSVFHFFLEGKGALQEEPDLLGGKIKDPPYVPHGDASYMD